MSLQCQFYLCYNSIVKKFNQFSYEEPFAIIKEIEKGVRQKTLKYITIQGRYMATCYAISKLSKGDILVIAGKGAEEYQDVLGVKSYYSDHNAVSDIIAKLDFGGEII